MERFHNWIETAEKKISVLEDWLGINYPDCSMKKQRDGECIGHTKKHRT